MPIEAAIAPVTEIFRPVIDLLISLVQHYGILGLFASALIGSTIFIPFSVEAAILVLIPTHANPYLLILVATAGALIGTWINYAIGFYASELAEKKIGPQNIEKAKNFMNKWGWPGLFLIVFIPTPIPTDPVTIIPGITRMNFLEFTIVILLAKILRYAVLVGLLEGIFNVMLIT